jgi:hypothetical protein
MRFSESLVNQQAFVTRRRGSARLRCSNIAALMTPGHCIIEGDSDPHVFISELIAHHAAGRFPFDRLIKTREAGGVPVSGY